MSSDKDNSDGSSPSGSIFAEHRRYVFGGITFIIAVVVLMVAIANGVIPNLAFLFNWYVAGFLLLSIIALMAVYLRYRYTSDSTPDWPFMSASPENWLSVREAQELGEWILFNEEPSIQVGPGGQTGVKKVTSGSGNSANRIYEAIVPEKNSADTYGLLINLEDSIDFDPEWLENRTVENMEKAEDALYDVTDYEVLKKKQSETRPEFEKRVEEARKNMGQSIRGQEVIEHYEDGEKSKVEKRDVLPVQIQNNDKG